MIIVRDARFEPGTAASAVGHTIPMIRHIFALVITASFIPKFFVYRFALVFLFYLYSIVFFFLSLRSCTYTYSTVVIFTVYFF